MSQIREILFGSQMREMQESLKDLRQMITISVEQLRTALAEQRRSLEASWSTQLQRLQDRLRIEQHDRVQGDENLNQQLRASLEAAEKTFSDFDSRIRQEHATLLETIQQASERVEKANTARQQSLARAFDERMLELKRQERSTLRQLFQHLGESLEAAETVQVSSEPEKICGSDKNGYSGGMAETESPA